MAWSDAARAAAAEARRRNAKEKGRWSTSYNRKGKAVRMFVPENATANIERMQARARARTATETSKGRKGGATNAQLAYRAKRFGRKEMG